MSFERTLIVIRETYLQMKSNENYSLFNPMLMLFGPGVPLH